MKIIHLITGLDQGGAEAVLYRLVSASRDSVRHIVVSMLGEGYYGARLRELGVPVYSLGMSRGAFGLHGVYFFFRLLRNERPCVVQTWMYHADLLGGLSALLPGFPPVVWGIRNSNLDPHKTSLSTRVVARCCAVLSRWAPSRIICCADQAARVHQTLGYRSDIFRVIHNGYDLARFSPDIQARTRQRKALGIADEEFLLGMVARWDPQKDHANLLAVLAGLRKQGHRLRCVLVGSGMVSDNAGLSGIIRRYGLQDWLILNGPTDDVPSIMNALDCHVMSSAYGEAFPNAVAEAMACGTPCVVTDVGDSALIVGDTGWVSPPSDVAALIRTVEQALAVLKAQGKEKTGEQARRRIVQCFSMDRMVESYLAVWKECKSPAE